VLSQANRCPTCFDRIRVRAGSGTADFAQPRLGLVDKLFQLMEGRFIQQACLPPN
jgi:hypothetical protein